jgi:hypothetical protein
MRLRMAGWPDEDVRDHAGASRLYGERRDDSGEGASTFHDGEVVDDAGRVVARISYNGRVWAPGAYDPAATPLWDNGTGSEG